MKTVQISTYFYTEEHSVPTSGTENLYAKKKKKKSDAGCPDFSVLSCQPFKPLFEKLSSPRLLPVLSCWHGSDSRRRISRGTVPVGTLRKAGKQSSGKQEHFARDFCEIGVSVHSPVQETPSNCEPFWTPRGPWSQINIVKPSEPIFTAWLKAYIQKTRPFSVSSKDATPMLQSPLPLC